MMQTNKIQIMDDMMRNLQRGDGVSNLRALQQMRQMQQPEPQRMKYMAQGGVPHLNSNRMIPQRVIERKYGGLAELPVTRAWGGFNPFKPVKRAVKGISKGVRNVGKGIQSGLSGIGDALGGGDSGNFLKNLAIQLALTYAMGPAGFNFQMGSMTPMQKFGLRFGKGYLGSALSGGVPGVTKNLLDPSKLTSGAMTASLGAIGDQFGPTPSGSLDADQNYIPVEGAPLKGDYAPSGDALAQDAAQKGFLERGKDSIMNFAKQDVPFIGTTATGESALTYGDVAASGAAAVAETEKQKQFDIAKKADQDAQGAAQALKDKMQGEQRSAAEFARLAVEDPVLYQYVYKYADN